MRRARGGIRHLAAKNNIRDPCCTLIARIVAREFLYLPAPRHPWLELPRLRHHLLDIVAPSTAPLAIENDKGNCGFAPFRLAGSLKDDRPDQVVTLLGVIAGIAGPSSEIGSMTSTVSAVACKAAGGRHRGQGRARHEEMSYRPRE